MRWKFVAPILAVGGAAVAVAAPPANYVDAKAGYRVTIPEGWSRRIDSGDNDLVVTSPNTETTFGICIVHQVPLPGTEKLSQAEMEQRLVGKYTASYWQRNFEESGFRNVVIEKSGEEVQQGRTQYYVVATYKQIRRAHRFKVVEYSLPGRSYNLTCDAFLEAYSLEEAAFETFFDSFVPINPAP
jgi:hypothetical protein